jgi:starvation-inducible DNA-binding protein
MTSTLQRHETSRHETSRQETGRQGTGKEHVVNTIKSPLGGKERTVTGQALQGALVDLIDLSLQGKQAHWNLVGRHFRSLHLQLDDVVASARTHSDTVAERTIALGVNPDGRAQTVADRSELTPLEAGYIQDDKVVAAFVERLAAIVGRMRERVRATAEPDPVTQDILITVTADLEKHLWMFQAER